MKGGVVCEGCGSLFVNFNSNNIYIENINIHTKIYRFNGRRDLSNCYNPSLTNVRYDVTFFSSHNSSCAYV